jgi:DNA-binding GntR family transcriptional regulator
MEMLIIPEGAVMGRKSIGTIEVELLADRAYEQLKKGIINRELPPGSRVSERHLASLMHTSNTTIKRALHKLSIEGLVEIRPRSGTFVSALREVNVEEITKIRASLEGLSANFAAAKAKPDDIRAMQAHFEIMARLTKAGDSQGLVKANAAFHQMIHQASGNPYITQLIKVVRSFEIGMRRMTLNSQEEMEYGFEGHRKIFEAIQAGNGALAEECMKQHVLGTLQIYLSSSKGNAADRPVD